MNKRESATIRRCITMLMEDRFHEAIEELARLGRMVYPAAVALRASKRSYSVDQLLKRNPLPKKRSKPRRVSVNRDAKYRRWLKTEPCVLAWPPDTRMFHPVDDPLFQMPNDACHTVNNGQSSKGPDSSCVPLCRYHHREYDAGRAAFEKKYGVSMPAIAAAHYARYQAETGKAAA